LLALSLVVIVAGVSGKPTGNLAVGVAYGDEPQQLALPRGEAGLAAAAAFGIEVGMVQVRAQQRQQCPVALGELPARAAKKIIGAIRPSARCRSRSAR